MIKPISPDEVGPTKKHLIPDKVIDCWNMLIALKSTGGIVIISAKS